jgi:hypothetical protein
MFKAFTGALSLALALLVLNWLLPEVMSLLIEATTKILVIINSNLDEIAKNTPQ